MLLEAHEIWQSLKDANWAVGTTHPDLKRPGKAPAIHAYLNPDGSGFTDLEFLTPEESLLHWTQSNGNHNSFPISKLTGPIAHEMPALEVTAWNRERSDEKRTLTLRSWIAAHPPGHWPIPFTSGMQAKLRERQVELEALKDTEAAPFLQLLEIVGNCGESKGSEWIHSLVDILLAKALEGGSESQSIAQRHLVNLLYSQTPVPIIWDLPLSGLEISSPSSPANFSCINQTLLAALGGLEQKHSEASCALTQKAGDVETDKFPQLTLPGIGKTYLFSRNRQTPSLERYRASGPEAFSVDRQHTRELAGAISALTSEERRGKTWTLVPSEQPQKSDLLIAYLRGAEDESMAAAIGTDQRACNDAQFQDFTERLLKRLNGDTKSQLRGKATLLVLRAVDPGNRKIIIREQFDAAHLEQASKAWGRGCQGLPGKKLFVPVEKGKPALLLGPPVLNPGSIPALTRRIFRMDGASTESVGGLTFSDSLELLLSFPEAEWSGARRALTIAYNRIEKLLANLSEASNGRTELLRDILPDVRWNALKAQSLLALLLSACKRPPTITMNSAAFRLGQLCAAFDVIHAAYCYVERKGDFPPHFIGNAAFQAASRNPIGALAQLSQRSAPHLAWLKRFTGDRKETALKRFPEKSDAWKAVIYALKLRGDQKSLSQALHEVFPELLPAVDDVFRAELLLGYLAGPSEAGESKASTTETISTQPNS